jgi:ABC-type nitrate/sulfonate/bicarbonate transport system permease component
MIIYFGNKCLRILIYISIYLGIYELISIYTNTYTEVVAFPDIDKICRDVFNYLKTEQPPFKGYLHTVERWIWFFPIAVVTGFVFGVVASSMKITRGWIGNDLDFWRSLPATLLYFFASALLGDNEITRTMPAWYVTFFTVSYFSFRATVQIDKRRITHLQELGAGWLFVLRHCLIYEVAHTVFIGIRQSVSLSFLVLISTELVVGSSDNVSIGDTFLDWSNFANYSMMLYGLLVIGFTGYLLNIVFYWVHKGCVFWINFDI